MQNKISNESLGSCTKEKIKPITPYNIALLLIIQCYMKNKYKHTNISSKYNRRQVMMKLLHVIQVKSLTLYDTFKILYGNIPDDIQEAEKILDEICKEKKLLKLYKFLSNLEIPLIDSNLILPKSSIICLFIRNILLKLEQYWFQDITKLLKKLILYYDEYLNEKEKKGPFQKDMYYTMETKDSKDLTSDFYKDVQQKDYNNAIKFVRRYFETQMTPCTINEDVVWRNGEGQNVIPYEDYTNLFCVGSYNMAILQQKFGHNEMASHHLREALQIVYATREEVLLDLCQTFLQAWRLNSSPSNDVNSDESFIFRRPCWDANGTETDVCTGSLESDTRRAADGLRGRGGTRKKSTNSGSPCFSENPQILLASTLRARYMVERAGQPQTIMDLLINRPELGCDSADAVAAKLKIPYTDEDLAREGSNRRALAASLSTTYGTWNRVTDLISASPDGTSPNGGNRSLSELCILARSYHSKGNFDARDAIANSLGIKYSKSYQVKTSESSSNFQCQVEDSIRISFLEMFIEQKIFDSADDKEIQLLLEELWTLDDHIASYWEALFSYYILCDYEAAFNLLIPHFQESSHGVGGNKSHPRTTLSNVQYQYLRIKCMIYLAKNSFTKNHKIDPFPYLMKALQTCYKYHFNGLALLVLLHIASFKLKLGGRDNTTESYILSNITRSHMVSSSFGTLNSNDMQHTYDTIQNSYFELTRH